MRKNASRAAHNIALPEQFQDQHFLIGVLEGDPAFVDNLAAARHRAAQGKVSDGQFRSIRRDLVHRAMYRFARAVELPAAVVPRLEAQVL